MERGISFGLDGSSFMNIDKSPGTLVFDRADSTMHAATVPPESEIVQGYIAGKDGSGFSHVYTIVLTFYDY
jgi:hypothetical protein